MPALRPAQSISSAAGLATSKRTSSACRRVSVLAKMRSRCVRGVVGDAGEGRGLLQAHPGRKRGGEPRLSRGEPVESHESVGFR